MTLSLVSQCLMSNFIIAHDFTQVYDEICQIARILQFMGKMVYVVGIPRRQIDNSCHIKTTLEILHRNPIFFRFVGFGKRLSCNNIINLVDGVHLTKNGLRQLRTIIKKRFFPVNCHPHGGVTFTCKFCFLILSLENRVVVMQLLNLSQVTLLFLRMFFNAFILHGGKILPTF